MRRGNDAPGSPQPSQVVRFPVDLLDSVQSAVITHLGVDPADVRNAPQTKLLSNQVEFHVHHYHHIILDGAVPSTQPRLPVSNDIPPLAGKSRKEYEEMANKALLDMLWRRNQPFYTTATGVPARRPEQSIADAPNDKDSKLPTSKPGKFERRQFLRPAPKSKLRSLEEAAQEGINKLSDLGTLVDSAETDSKKSATRPRSHPRIARRKEAASQTPKLRDESFEEESQAASESFKAAANASKERLRSLVTECANAARSEEQRRKELEALKKIETCIRDEDQERAVSPLSESASEDQQDETEKIREMQQVSEQNRLRMEQQAVQHHQQQRELLQKQKQQQEILEQQKRQQKLLEQQLLEQQKQQQRILEQQRAEHQKLKQLLLDHLLKEQTRRELLEHEMQKQRAEEAQPSYFSDSSEENKDKLALQQRWQNRQKRKLRQLSPQATERLKEENQQQQENLEQIQHELQRTEQQKQKQPSQHKEKQQQQFASLAKQPGPPPPKYAEQRLEQFPQEQRVQAYQISKQHLQQAWPQKIRAEHHLQQTKYGSPVQQHLQQPQPEQLASLVQQPGPRPPKYAEQRLEQSQTYQSSEQHLQQHALPQKGRAEHLQQTIYGSPVQHLQQRLPQQAASLAQQPGPPEQSPQEQRLQTYPSSELQQQALPQKRRAEHHLQQTKYGSPTQHLQQPLPQKAPEHHLQETRPQESSEHRLQQAWPPKYESSEQQTVVVAGDALSSESDMLQDYESVEHLQQHPRMQQYERSDPHLQQPWPQILEISEPDSEQRKQKPVPQPLRPQRYESSEQQHMPQHALQPLWPQKSESHQLKWPQQLLPSSPDFCISSTREYMRVFTEQPLVNADSVAKLVSGYRFGRDGHDRSHQAEDKLRFQPTDRGKRQELKHVQPRIETHATDSGKRQELKHVQPRIETHAEDSGKRQELKHIQPTYATDSGKREPRIGTYGGTDRIRGEEKSRMTDEVKYALENEVVSLKKANQRLQTELYQIWENKPADTRVLTETDFDKLHQTNSMLHRQLENLQGKRIKDRDKQDLLHNLSNLLEDADVIRNSLTVSSKFLPQFEDHAAITKSLADTIQPAVATWSHADEDAELQAFKRAAELKRRQIQDIDLFARPNEKELSRLPAAQTTSTEQAEELLVRQIEESKKLSRETVEAMDSLEEQYNRLKAEFGEMENEMVLWDQTMEDLSSGILAKVEGEVTSRKLCSIHHGSEQQLQMDRLDRMKRELQDKLTVLEGEIAKSNLHIQELKIHKGAVKDLMNKEVEAEEVKRETRKIRKRVLQLQEELEKGRFLCSFS